MNYSIALVWLANGLFCKVLNLVPRHQEIVATILGQEHARLLTIAIGISEILMAIWILSGIKIETQCQFPDRRDRGDEYAGVHPGARLLLWGRFNALFALLLILVIYYHEFHLKPKTRPHH